MVIPRREFKRLLMICLLITIVCLYLFYTETSRKRILPRPAPEFFCFRSTIVYRASNSVYDMIDLYTPYCEGNGMYIKCFP